MGCKACDKPKPNYRKGLWSPEEDQKLRDYIIRHGHGCWSALPSKAGKTNHPPPMRARVCISVGFEGSVIQEVPRVHCTRNSELERRQLPIGEGKKVKKNGVVIRRNSSGPPAGSF